MRETGPASITPSGVPADRRDAAALALPCSHFSSVTTRFGAMTVF